MTPEFKTFIKCWMPFLAIILPTIIISGILFILFPFTFGHSYNWLRAMANWLDKHIPVPFGKNDEAEKIWERYKEELLNEAKKK